LFNVNHHLNYTPPVISLSMFTINVHFVIHLCNSYNCSMIYVNTNMEDMYVF